jgi:hypothetical protein
MDSILQEFIITFRYSHSCSSGVIPSDFPTKNLYEYTISLMPSQSHFSWGDQQIRGVRSFGYIEYFESCITSPHGFENK